MQHPVRKADILDLNATVPALDAVRETSVLNLLQEAIFILGASVPQDDRPPKYVIRFVNHALCRLVSRNASELVGKELSQTFAPQTYGPLYDALQQAMILQDFHEVEMSFRKQDEHVQLRVALTPRLGDDLNVIDCPPLIPRAEGEEEEERVTIVGCVHDISTLATRANYLEDRAVKLIDHSNQLEESRRELEAEVGRLRTLLKSKERSARFDRISGLPNRAHFVERGAGEFQRSRRYEHELSIVITRVQGFDHIVEEYGEVAGECAITALAQMCESSYRTGTDLAGRVSETEIAILLPETGLAGALQFVERLRAQIANTPVQIGHGSVRMGILSSIDSMQSDDTGFMQSLNRAMDALSDI